MQNDISDLSRGRDLLHVAPVKVQNREEQLGDRGVLQIGGKRWNSESVYATNLSLDQVLPVDVIWLDKAVALDYHEVTVEDILDGLQTGKFQLWRLGEGGGIAVTTILTYPKGRELCIAYVAGEGYLENFETFIKELKAFGRALGCRWLCGIAARKGTEKIYAQVGERLGTLFKMELN